MVRLMRRPALRIWGKTSSWGSRVVAGQSGDGVELDESEQAVE